MSKLSELSFSKKLLVLATLLPLAFVWTIASAAWWAWWLYPAWGWFVVSLGVRQIGFWHFAALVFLAKIITHQSSYKKDDRPTDWGFVIASYLVPIFTWLVLRWMR